MATKTLRPSANYSVEFTGNPETNYDNVNDSPVNDSTYNYNSSVANTKTDKFNISFGVTTLSISSVKVYVRAKNSTDDGINSADLWIKIVTGGSEYSSSRISIGASWENNSKEWTTNPKTGVAWTDSDIENLIIGYSGYSVYNPSLLVSDIYVVVTYTPLDPPTVTTQAVTNITYNSATLNGNITDTGGENATERGFEYKEGAEGEVSKVYNTGDFGTGAFSKGLSGLKPNTKYYVRAYAKNSAGTGYGDWVDFTTDKTTPTVTTQDATDIDKDSFTANGNITATGGENCTVRGFKYGYTPVDTWDVHDEGSFETGAFTKAITGLSPNTIYWIRAYATNSEGTSYGDWVKVTTASAGTTPSGTKIQLAGDYSGYVNQMHASEQDLGANYKGYFVLSTDLADKQGLAFYKRLLYLTNYFRKETSGTVKIYVKCDSEANWREIGEVDLTGSEDILMEDLGIDELGKHFLIKFEGENIFRYIGTIFWYLVQGVR